MAPVAEGYLATERARAKALAHPHCVHGHADAGAPIIQVCVTGSDDRGTIQEIQPYESAGCIIGELEQDPNVRLAIICGFIPPASTTEQVTATR